MGVERWVTWRQHVEIWQWVEELAAREPRDAPDAEILRMAAVVALRRGQIPPMRQLTERCVTADPAGPAGPSAQLALILLAYAERRWHDLRTLVTASQHQDPEQHAFEQILLVYAYLHFGDTQAARDAARQACAAAESLGEPGWRALALLALARVRQVSGQVPTRAREVRNILDQASTLARSVDLAEIEATVSLERARFALIQGAPEDAVEPGVLRLPALARHRQPTRNGGRIEAAVPSAHRNRPGLDLRANPRQPTAGAHAPSVPRPPLDYRCRHRAAGHRGRSGPPPDDGVVAKQSAAFRTARPSPSCSLKSV